MGSLRWYPFPWEEILARLPDRDLLRFRVVCEDWKELISSESFGKYHAQVGPGSGPWLMCLVEDHAINPLLLMHNPRTNRGITTKLELTKGDIGIDDGYGGLICKDEGDPIAFNLSTRTWKRFPLGFKVDQLLFHNGHWIAVSLGERTIHTIQETRDDSSSVTRRTSWTRRTLSSFAARSGHLFCVVTALNGMLNLEECSTSSWSWHSYLFARLKKSERMLLSVNEFVCASIAPPIILNVRGELLLIALLWSSTNQQKLVIYKLRLVVGAGERVAECIKVSTFRGALVGDVEKLRAVAVGKVIYIRTSEYYSSRMLSYDMVSRKWGRLQLLHGGAKYFRQKMHVFAYHGPVLRTKLSQNPPKLSQNLAPKYKPVLTLVGIVFSFLFLVVFFFLPIFYYNRES